MTKLINFTAGVAAGAIVGMAISAIVDPINSRQKRYIQRKSNHAVKAIGNALDCFADMF